MEIKQEDHKNFTTLMPVGELDANSSIDLDERIMQLIGAGKVKIHMDMSEVTYISSAGLGVFISYLDELAAKNGKIIFSQPTDSVGDVFDLLGLNQLVTIVKDGDNVEQLFETE